MRIFQKIRTWYRMLYLSMAEAYTTRTTIRRCKYCRKFHFFDVTGYSRQEIRMANYVCNSRECKQKYGDDFKEQITWFLKSHLKVVGTGFGRMLDAPYVEPVCMVRSVSRPDHFICIYGKDPYARIGKVEKSIYTLVKDPENPTRFTLNDAGRLIDFASEFGSEKLELVFEHELKKS